MTEQPAGGIRVLIADDHPLFRAGLATLLRVWGYEVVGEAADGKAAVELARSCEPEIVFMDINMPELDGIEATRAIKTESPDVRVVMMTVSDDEHDLVEAIKSGADGYLLKNMDRKSWSR